MDPSADADADYGDNGGGEEKTAHACPPLTMRPCCTKMPLPNNRTDHRARSTGHGAEDGITRKKKLYLFGGDVRRRRFGHRNQTRFSNYFPVSALHHDRILIFTPGVCCFSSSGDGLVLELAAYADGRARCQVVHA